MRLPSASLPVERVAPSTRKVTVCRSPYWAVTVWFSAATMELAVISVPSDKNQPLKPSAVTAGSSPYVSPSLYVRVTVSLPLTKVTV